MDNVEAIKDWRANNARLRRQKVEQLEQEQQSISQNEPMDEPVAFFAESGLSGTPPLDVALLPAPMQQFCHDTAERIGVPPEMIAMPAITSLATAISHQYRVQMKRHDTSWSEGKNLWTVAFGAPSSKKTPALDAALAPLSDLEKSWRLEDSKRNEAFELDHEIWESKKKKAKNALGGKNNPTTAEAAFRDVCEQEPARPRSRRLIVGDATTEKLADIWNENPSGVLSKQDELVGLFASFDAYRDKSQIGNKDRTVYLRAFNGEKNVPVDRVRSGTKIVDIANLCITGGIQPTKLAEIAAKLTSDGMFQRFIPYHAENVGPGVDRKPDQAAVDAFTDLLVAVGNDPAEPLRIYLSAEAIACREQLEVLVGHLLLVGPSDHFCEFANKWPGIFGRLCLIYHVAEAVHESIPPESEVVSGDVAARVLKLFAEFILPHSLHVYGLFFEDNPVIGDAKEIARWILASQADRVTIRDVRRNVRSTKTSPHIIDALHILDEFGWLNEDEDARKGSCAYFVNPTVHQRFAEQAERERQAKQAKREAILRACQELGIGQ